MSQPPPSPSNNRGMIASIIGQVLSYIDRPWKGLVVALLVIIAGFGWVLYTHQEELIEAWLTPSTVELTTADIPQALAKLSEETTADLVQIWSIDLASNSQHFIAARRHDGERPVIPSPRRLPIIVTVSDIRALERVLEGQPVCVDISEVGSPLARRLADRGMHRGCAIPIPPSAQKFLGVIYLAWANAADPSSEQVAVGAAREIAATLVTR